MSTSDTWTGKGRHASWFARQNWTSGVPTGGDAVAFDDGGDWTIRLGSRQHGTAQALSMTVDADALTLTGGRLSLGRQATGSDLTVANAGALTIAASAAVRTHEGTIIGSLDETTETSTGGTITLGGKLATPTLTMVTGTITVQARGALNVAGTMTLTAFDDVYFNVTPGALEVAGSVRAGTITGAGSIMLSGPAASLHCATLQTVGDLIVSNGAKAGAATVMLGNVTTTHFGTAIVDGTASTLTASLIEDGGFESNAALTVENGGRIRAGTIDFNTYLTDNTITVTGSGSSIDAGTLAVGAIANLASLSVTEAGTLSLGAGGLTLELCPLLLDSTAKVKTPFIDSLAGTIAAVAGAGRQVFIRAPVMLGVAPQTSVGQSVFISGTGAALDVVGAVTGSSGTTLATVGQVTLANGANSLPSIEIESGRLTLEALGAAGKSVIDFANVGGAACTLQYDPDASLPNVLTDFGTGDSVDLRGFAFDPGITDSFDAGTLTLTDGAGAVSLVFSGSYSDQNFTLQADQHGGTLIKFQG